MPNSIRRELMRACRCIAIREVAVPRQLRFLASLASFTRDSSMQFPQANQRRRRVLADDLSAGDDAASRTAVPPPSRSHRRIDGYAPGAKPEQQRRVIDLVPGSHLAFGLWFAAGLTVIAALAAGHVWLSAIASRLSAEAAASLELGAGGSLSGWVASLWLGLAGATCALIYSIRRHKLDDYRGRYRWWLFGSIAWFVMSVDATCGIHQLFAATMIRLTGCTGPGGGVTWWLGFWGLVVCALSVRLAWEMRVCRPAMTAYLSAIVFWTCGIVIQLTGVRLGAASNALPAEVAKLLGHLSLLLGVSMYARHVILHAQGLLPSRKRRPNANKEKQATAAPSKTRTDLQPHVDLRAMASDPAENDEPESEPPSASNTSNSRRDVRPTPLPTTQTEQDEQDSGDGRDIESNSEPESDGGDNRKLSKAERKRLRKLKAQHEQGW
jgi:hypothetical protein